MKVIKKDTKVSVDGDYEMYLPLTVERYLNAGFSSSAKTLLVVYKEKLSPLLFGKAITVALEGEKYGRVSRAKSMGEPAMDFSSNIDTNYDSQSKHIKWWEYQTFESVGSGVIAIDRVDGNLQVTFNEFNSKDEGDAFLLALKEGVIEREREKAEAKAINSLVDAISALSDEDKQVFATHIMEIV